MGAVQIAGAAEGLVTAERAGLDLHQVARALTSGQAASPQVVRNAWPAAAEALSTASAVGVRVSQQGDLREMASRWRCSTSATSGSSANGAEHTDDQVGEPPGDRFGSIRRSCCHRCRTARLDRRTGPACGARLGGWRDGIDTGEDAMTTTPPWGTPPDPEREGLPVPGFGSPVPGLGSSVPGLGGSRPAVEEASFFLLVEQLVSSRDASSWRGDPAPLPAGPNRHTARQAALHCARTFRPHHPFSPQRRDVYRVDKDTYLVIVTGRKRSFHFRVSVAERIAPS
jgi:hypothetical protein